MFMNSFITMSQWFFSLVYLNRSIDSFDTMSCSGFFLVFEFVRFIVFFSFLIFVLPSFAFVSLAKFQKIVISWTLCSCCLIAYGNFKTNIDIDAVWSMVPLTIAWIRFRSYGISNTIFCFSFIILTTYWTISVVFWYNSNTEKWVRIRMLFLL